jgi:hypothetical protein
MENIWTINDDLAERNRFKAFNKKHPREYAACFANLAHVVELLNRSGGAGTFQVGFFRSEGENVYRIGQTGVKHAVETRLYVYVYTQGHTVYVLTIGDKTQQADDIRRCKAIARDWVRRREHEEEKEIHERSHAGG